VVGSRRPYSSRQLPRRSRPRSSSSARIAANDDSVTGFERIVRVVGAIVAPATILTALMFYFGWIYTNALFGHFGIEAPVLEFSNQDYMLRSAQALYVPIGALLVVALLSLWAHGLVARMLIAQRGLQKLQIAAGILVVGGLMLFMMGLAGIVNGSLFGNYVILAPLGLGFGAVIGAYGRWLLQRSREIHTGRPPSQQRWFINTNIALVILLLIVGLFWTVSEYAAAFGRGEAQRFADGLVGRPGVTVYSADRLFLNAPGVIETTLPADPHAAYRYRYDGLRLLTKAHGRFFLLPQDWSPGHAPAIMLDHSDRIRVEFVPGWGE
jgi:hypothetical protein